MDKLSYKIEVGDSVHCRLYNEDRSNVVTQTFDITEIKGSIYLGGVLPCDTSEGWEVELWEKSASNLALPESLSEITVLLSDGSIAHVFGKNTLWTRENGQSISVRQIFAWENGFIGVETIRDDLS